MKNRITTAVLLLLMLAQLTACSGADETDTVAPESDMASTVPEETRLWKDDLPELHFDDQTFTVAIYENPDARNHVFSTEQTADTINDAIYEATLNVSERFHVTLEELVDAKYGNDAFRTSVMAGDAAFHVANTRAPNALSYYAEGLVTPFDELPYIDLSQPYWASDANEILAIQNVHYTALGDMNLSAYDLTHVLLFNEKLVEDYYLDSPFDLIDKDAWIFDTMYAMMETVTTDTDGNGAMEETDQYGYAGYGMVVAQNFWIAGGVKTVSKDEEGLYQLDLSNENTVEYMTKLTEKLCNSDVAYYKNINEYYDAMPDWEIAMFSNDQVLFANSTLRYMESLRDMDTDFGIVPYPKQNAAQEKYYVRLGYWNAPLVPASNPDTDLIGAMLEALNAEYSRVVRPRYFDTALKGKIARNEEDIRMLDLILESRTIDVGDVLFSGSIRPTLINVFMKGSTDYMSSIAANQQKNEKALQDALPKELQE